MFAASFHRFQPVLLGPSGSESSTSQATTQQQVGAQGGGDGSTTVATGAGSSNTGAQGNQGVTVTGGTSTVNITSTDASTVQGALGLGEQAVADASTNTNTALSALEQIESENSVVEASTIQGNANVATGAEQAISGQQVSSAFGSNNGGNFSGTEIIAFGALILAAVFYLTRKH